MLEIWENSCVKIHFIHEIIGAVTMVWFVPKVNCMSLGKLLSILDRLSKNREEEEKEENEQH